MVTRPRPRGDHVRSRGNDFYITEHAHAYVVRSDTIPFGPSIDQARLALFKWLGNKKWTRICGMPHRHFYTGGIGEDVPCIAVAFYFNIGKRDRIKPKERDRYKP